MVRRIGQSIETWLVAVMVRPSSGSPRRPDSGQAMTLSGTDSRVRARVSPAAATTTPTSTARATTPPASRSIVVDASTAASTAQAIVHGSRRCRATTHISRPAASIVRHTARPTLRSGQVRAAHAPMPRAASTVSGWAGTPCSGQKRRQRRPPRAGARPGRGTAGVPGSAAGRGRGPPVGVGLVGVVGAVTVALLTEVGGPAGAGAPGQDGAQVCTGGSGGGGQRRDGAAVQLAHPARDGQAQAGAAGGVAAGAEPVEDPLDAVGRDAGALVAHLEPPGVVVDARARRPAPRPCGGLCRTALSTRLATSWASRAGSATTVRSAGLRLVAHHARRRPPTRASATAAPSRSPTRTSVSAQRRGAGVDAGQVEQVADEGAEPLGSGSGRRAGRRRRAARRRRRGSRAGRAGRSSGVRSSWETVADELAALLVGGGEVGRHRVERAAQRADLVGRGGRDALRVVARRHPSRGGRHLAQRRGHPAGQPLGHARARRPR